MKRDSKDYNNLKEEVINMGVNFFNEVLATKYDYCVIADELLFALFLLVKNKIINRYDIPIYTKVYIDIDLSDELVNQNILVLFNSVTDLEDWENVKLYLHRLKNKMHPISLQVNILMIAKEIADELSFEGYYPSSNKTTKTASDEIVRFSLNHKFNLDFNNINEIFQSLNDSELGFALRLLFCSIFETDFMLDEDKETIIFTDVILYLILLHFIENKTISNEKQKSILLHTEIEKNSNTILDSTVITVVSVDTDKNVETTEDIKRKIFNINPNLAESDIYLEDLVHI